MHVLIPESNDWVAEYLRDDSDMAVRYEIVQKVLRKTALTRIVLGAMRVSEELLEHIRSQGNGSIDLADKLRGCSFIGYYKSNDTLRARITFEEHRHNERVYVEGRVFPKTDRPLEKVTIRDLLFYEREKFSNQDCKKEASAYARELRTRIDNGHFSGRIAVFKH